MLILSSNPQKADTKKVSKAKNSTPADYCKSTAVEAVIGYLYVTGNVERMNYLLSLTEEKGE